MKFASIAFTLLATAAAGELYRLIPLPLSHSSGSINASVLAEHDTGSLVLAYTGDLPLVAMDAPGPQCAVNVQQLSLPVRLSAYSSTCLACPDGFYHLLALTKSDPISVCSAHGGVSVLTHGGQLWSYETHDTRPFEAIPSLWSFFWHVHPQALVPMHGDQKFGKSMADRGLLDASEDESAVRFMLGSKQLAMGASYVIAYMCNAGLVIFLYWRRQSFFPLVRRYRKWFLAAWAVTAVTLFFSITVLAIHAHTHSGAPVEVPYRSPAMWPPTLQSLTEQTLGRRAEQDYKDIQRQAGTLAQQLALLLRGAAVPSNVTLAWPDLGPQPTSLFEGTQFQALFQSVYARYHASVMAGIVVAIACALAVLVPLSLLLRNVLAPSPDTLGCLGFTWRIALYLVVIVGAVFVGTGYGALLIYGTLDKTCEQLQTDLPFPGAGPLLDFTRMTCRPGVPWYAQWAAHPYREVLDEAYWRVQDQLAQIDAHLAAETFDHGTAVHLTQAYASLLQQLAENVSCPYTYSQTLQLFEVTCNGKAVLFSTASTALLMAAFFLLLFAATGLAVSEYTDVKQGMTSVDGSYVAMTHDYPLEEPLNDEHDKTFSGRSSPITGVHEVLVTSDYAGQHVLRRNTGD